MKLGFKVTKNTAFDKLDRYPDDVQAEVRASFPVIGRHLKGIARSIVPVRTGLLRSTIDFEVRGGTTLSLFANTPYAQIIEKRKPYLRPALEQGTHFINEEIRAALMRAMLRGD
jgi:hypothetical protein